MNKLRRTLATLLVGITLCGSVLVVHAAEPRTCTNHAPLAQNERNEMLPVGTHTLPDGRECTIRHLFKVYDIICTKCGVKIAEGRNDLGGEAHSINH